MMVRRQQGVLMTVCEFVLGIGVLATAAQCGGGPPSSPSPSGIVSAPQQIGLTIQPITAGLKVDSVKPFAAYVEYSDGSKKAVQPEWSSSNTAVVAVDALGTVTAVALGSAVLTAKFETFLASAQVSVVPDVAGKWSGQARIVDCKRLSGDAPDPCRFIIGAQFPISLDLQQTDDTLAGTCDMYSAPDVAHGKVSGRVLVDGTVSLLGTLYMGEGGTSVDITDWQTTLDSTFKAITGQFTAIRHFSNFFGGPQVTQELCKLLALDRVVE
jgi:Bacterial Ig-like domain (group 2)